MTSPFFRASDHLKVEHEYSTGNWQDVTPYISGMSINLREWAGKHSASLSFYNDTWNPQTNTGTHVVKKGDRVRVSMHNPGATWRQIGMQKVRRVIPSPTDFTAPSGRQNLCTLHLGAIAGVGGVGGSGSSGADQSIQPTGVGSIEELSNLISGPFEIGGDGFGSGITTPTNGVVLRTNRCVNPSFETNTSNWLASGTGSSIARVTSGGFVGACALQISQSGSSTDGAAQLTLFGLTVGQTYTLSAYGKTVSGTVNGFAVDAITTGSVATPNSTSYTRASNTFVATSTTQVVKVRFHGTGAFVGLADAVLIEQSAILGDYFDGDTTDTDSYNFGWSGTAHASTSTGTGTYTEVAVINDATEFDQVLLTKDSNPGVIAFEDPYGTVQIFDSAIHRTGAATRTFTSSDYQGIPMRFDIEDVTNVLTLFYFEKVKTGKKNTRKVKHSVVYTTSDAAFSSETWAGSIGKYGRCPKKHHVHKKTDFQAYAKKVFARNADPDNVPTSITLPITKQSQLLGGYEDGQFVGNKVIVVLPDGVTTYTCRVRRIQHQIRPSTDPLREPDKWLVTLFLRHQDLHVARKHGNKDTGEANNQDGTIQGSHLDDDVDATGKTVSNGTVQTSSDTGANRIVMRDDGSEGVIEFGTGAAGETLGKINPGVVSGQHQLVIRTSKGASSPFNQAAVIEMLGSSSVQDPTVVLDGTDLLIDGGQAIVLGPIQGNNITSLNKVEGNTLQMDSPPTTTSAANVRVGAGGVLNTVTSLGKYKVDQVRLAPEVVAKLKALQPTTWFDATEVEENSGTTDGLRRVLGYIAEEVEAVAPEFAEYDEAGELAGVDYRGIAVAALAYVVNLEARMEARLAALEASH